MFQYLYGQDIKKMEFYLNFSTSDDRQGKNINFIVIDNY
ncbi:MAG: hypothetical protein N5P05_001679 [Chroococcopsis gigantea SAG 12.99]|nr:hypothetical protein [Chroococcopsis gigantea SAG 12.99]